MGADTKIKLSGDFVSIRRGAMAGAYLRAEADLTAVREWLVENALPAGKQGRERSRRGPPPKYAWGAIRDEAFRLMNHHGDFSDDDPEWDAQARLEKKLQEFCSGKKRDKEPSPSTLETREAPRLACGLAQAKKSGRQLITGQYRPVPADKNAGFRLISFALSKLVNEGTYAIHSTGNCAARSNRRVRDGRTPAPPSRAVARRAPSRSRQRQDFKQRASRSILGSFPPALAPLVPRQKVPAPIRVGDRKYGWRLGEIIDGLTERANTFARQGP